MELAMCSNYSVPAHDAGEQAGNVPLSAAWRNESGELGVEEESSLEMPLFATIIICVLYALIFLVGIFGNVLVIVVIFTNRHMRNSTNYYLASLSTADLFIVCFSVNPILVVIVLIWLSSLLISFPVLYFTRYYATCHSKKLEVVYICSTELAGNESYFYALLLGLYVLPGVVMSVIYTVVMKALMASSLGSFNSGDSRKFNNSQQEKFRRQILLMCISVVVLYFICMFPYNLTILLVLAWPEFTYNHLGFVSWQTFLAVSRILFFLNSCVNPIIYNAISSRFRNACLATLRLECTLKRRNANFQQSSYYTSSVGTSFRSGHHKKSTLTSTLAPSINATPEDANMGGTIKIQYRRSVSSTSAHAATAISPVTFDDDDNKAQRKRLIPEITKNGNCSFQGDAAYSLSPSAERNEDELHESLDIDGATTAISQNHCFLSYQKAMRDAHLPMLETEL